MIVVFDMDDTLYDEMTYVRSGFAAVADAAAQAWGLNAGELFDFLLRSLAQNGRGTQFDELGRAFGHPERYWVRRFLRLYREHDPAITLPDETREVLRALDGRPLYVVTDGHKLVQQRKAQALGLAPLFKRIFITRRYGLHCEKPSPEIFLRLLAAENCPPSHVVYIGDNPRKDFLGIRPLGFRTIRLLQGSHRQSIAAKGCEAERRVRQLRDILPIIRDWEKQL